MTPDQGTHDLPQSGEKQVSVIVGLGAPSLPPLHQTTARAEAPVALPRWAPLTWRVRALLLAIAAFLVTIFILAMWINPYNPDGTPRRMATHRQLGLPPCNFFLLTGKPCPSCGMTTSFALLFHGDLRASLQANWVGTLLAVAAVVACPWAVLSAVWGRFLGIPHQKMDLFISLALSLLFILMIARWLALLWLTAYDS